MCGKCQGKSVIKSWWHNTDSYMIVIDDMGNFILQIDMVQLGPKQSWVAEQKIELV